MPYKSITYYTQIKMIKKVILFIFICVLAGAIGRLLLKAGFNELHLQPDVRELFRGHNLKLIFTNKWLLLGFSSLIFGIAFWLIALATLDLSAMYPLLSIGYVLTIIFSLVFLKETITLDRWIGILLIGAGTYFIARSV
ncbi:4-amino-4-deoxy-L-arabinose-phosphoundecaprenol flippase subunit ArnE [uncultured archaeon]|nr:4-amino-4-deoxy-L-arabinose-phosphoundecaprenol flippase subunit ArnE [uncultured archaeon]